MRIDFFARRPHYIDHLAPIWHALHPDRRGAFYVPEGLLGDAAAHEIEAVGLQPRANRPLSVGPGGTDPLVVCSYGDLEKAWYVSPRRPFIFLEHGVGLTFHNPGYAGNLNLRRNVALFLNPNEHTQRKNARAVPQAGQAIIGTPKLDEYQFLDLARQFLASDERKPVVAISFHWDGRRIAPEAGNAFAHYQSILPQLAQQPAFTLIGHGHPRIIDELAPIYEELGVEVVRDFREVMERADLYVNDCSSTMYEFCVTGKPVIVLNSPRFRRNIKWGIRFWEYSDVGINVEHPADLLPAIERALADPAKHAPARAKAVQDLYPYLGGATARAVTEITKFCERINPPRRSGPRQSMQPVITPPRRIDQVGGETIGILYMGFGARAAAQIRKSIASLHQIGLDLPVAVVGDVPIEGATAIPWTGPSPFDPRQRPYMQFRAGRVKPHLQELTPFQRTLYLDADTEFMGDILPGFELLSEVDLAVTEDSTMLAKIHNKPHAHWEYNLAERDATMEELGRKPSRWSKPIGVQRLFNSGVIFFQKCPAVAALFEEWSRQWLCWQEWDEQLALLRALNAVDVHYQVLGMEWNQPNRQKARIIFHAYSRGVARLSMKQALIG